jgi:hypothetical protein
MQRIKDLFLFQCFTGLSYTDLEVFSRGSIVNSEDGFKEIHDYRIKTKQKYASLLLPIAEEIAEKYDYNFEENPPASIGEAVAKIEELAGIKRSKTQARKFLKDSKFRFQRVGTVPAKALSEEKKRAAGIFGAELSAPFGRSQKRRKKCVLC